MRASTSGARVPRSAVEVIAHRGFSARAPENTLASLEAALVAGADAVEFDLHAAAEGTPVLLHDATLNRTTDGVGPARLLTPEQLKRLDAGAWFSSAFAGERIPTLAEALELVRGRIGRVYAEVKGFRALDDVDRMVDVVERCGMLERTVFIAIDWSALDRARSVRPDAHVGYIVEKPERSAEALERARADSGALVDFDARILLDEPGHAARAGAAGVPLAVWTVDDAVTAGRLADMGVGRITTNRVDALLEWKRAT